MAQHHIVSKEEWKAIKKNRKIGQRNIDLIIEHKAMPRSHYIHARTKGHDAQKELAEIFMPMANLPLDTKESIADIRTYEELLDVQILVIDSSIGNI